jgi:hypothetical protein
MAEQPPDPGRRRGGLPIMAIILIALGVVLLLQTTGVLSWGLWGELWRFWPIILIAIGINLIIGGRMPWVAVLLIILLVVASVGIALALAVDERAGVIEGFEQPLDGLESVAVRIDFGAGKLTVGSLPDGSPNLAEGTLKGRKGEVKLVQADGSTELQISMDERGALRRFSNVSWSILLSRVPKLSLRLNGGAADMTLDLRDLKVTALDVNTGAADVEITMPASAGHTRADISGGAADVEIVVPEGVAARVTSSSGLSDVDIDASRFPKSGDVWASPDFDTATNRVEIEIKVGASSVSVR